MQEETNLEQNAEVYESINAEENTDGVTQDETIEYIDVQEQEAYVIEIDEAFASNVENDELNHALLTNRDKSDQHPIGAITNLQNILNDIQSLKGTLYASSGGLSEFRKWADENPSWDNRSGYFVSIVDDGEIAICNKEANDVYGVVVSSSAFCGYQENINKSGNPLYAMVCLVGNVKVRIREDANIVAGDYVIADNYGYAMKSESNVGFRVLSVGTDPILEYYASISLVPQNDNVSRVMEELSSTNGELSNVIIQLGNLESGLIEVERNSSNAIDVAEDAKGIVDMLNETVGSMGIQLKRVTEIADQASKSAQRAIEDANAIYTSASATAQSAKEQADSALGGIQDLQKNLEPLAKWGEGDNKGIVGFVLQANEDHVELSELLEKYGDNGTDIIAIKKKIDENGAAIENLVVHVDKYSIGPYSVTYNLTYDEAVSIMRDGHIYVATAEHTEALDEDSYIFKSGSVYQWYTENEKSRWLDTGKVVTFYTTETTGTNVDDLWYCSGGIRDENDKIIYYPETLYRWDGSQWLPVTTIDGGLQARTLGLVRQTANELTSTYTELSGDVSVMKQTVNEISATVANVEGEVSAINQAADSIIAGTYDPEGSSSLSMLLDYSFTAVSEGRYHKRINSFVGAATVVGNRYNQPPTWSEDKNKFVFNDSYVHSEGKYYFNSDDHTTYCKTVDGGYEVYTIGNTAISALNNRVSDTESEMDSWTRFKTGTNETMSVISQTSNEDGADIASVVYGNYRQCVEIKTELTDEEKNKIPIKRYNKAPDYADSSFTFDGAVTTDGKYYMLEGDNLHYYKVINPDDEIIGYEKYTMKTSNYASIMQKVDENGSVVGLVANNNDVEGGIFVTAINNSTTALISADKIGINGTAVFTDNAGDGSTTISGNYIRTGILQSNNYSEPVVIKNNGIKISKITGELQNYFQKVTVKHSVSITVPDGEQVVYNNVFDGFDGSKFNNDFVYFNYDGVLYGVQIYMMATLEGICYYANTYDPEASIPDGTQLDLYETLITYDSPIYKLQEGESTDCIWYSHIKQGINYNLSPTGNSYRYYIGDGIGANDELELLSNMSLSPSSYTGYIISANSFELTTNGTIEGTRFNLDDGTIISKNLVLDSNGDLSITGKITATSGFIGDSATNGFEINKNTENGAYYLSYNQDSLTGDSNKTLGIYMGLEGIGLGNGKFYVDAAGNVVLNGSITWGEGNTPVLVLYAVNPSAKPPNKGEDGWMTYNEYDPSSSTKWHKIYSTSDKYASYSYNSGTSWTDLVKIQGTDGEPGSSGLTYVRQLANGTFSSPECTFIRQKMIWSPEIVAGKLYASGTANANGEIINGDGTKAYAEISGSYFTITPIGDDKKFDTNNVVPKLRLGYANPNNDMETGGRIELVLGAGWSNTGSDVPKDIFEISKIKSGATIKYVDDSGTSHSINFTSSGISGDFVATFG